MPRRPMMPPYAALYADYTPRRVTMIDNMLCERAAAPCAPHICAARDVSYKSAGEMSAKEEYVTRERARDSAR